MKLAKLNSGPEIFASVQGEGRNLGQFSVFVRVSLCNLHCIWCDTDYTWNWIDTKFPHVRDSDPSYSKYKKNDQIVELSTDVIATMVRSLRAKNVVLTGGEPLLQQDDFVTLMRTLRMNDQDYRFEVETNATVIPSTDFDSEVDQYNVSPKLANSGNDRIRLRTEAIDFFANSHKAWFKFVCGSLADIDEVSQIVSTHSIKSNRVFLMPEGTTSDTIRTTSALLIDRCIELGYNFSDRLHVHLFRNKRGT